MADSPEGSASVDSRSAVGRGVFTATDVISDLPSEQPETNLPALFYLMVVGFGLAGGAFFSRRLDAARSGPRH
jgi:hypothetical protein